MTNLQPYSPPDFASKIARYAPKYRLDLALLPTPIQEWHLHRAFPELSKDLSIFIKRDDMTGSTTGGNKIRKLEFLLADALSKGCDTVITAGGVQSNHARATAVAAKELGMDAHVFLRSREADKPKELGSDGNVLLHKMLGVKMHLIRPVSYLVGILPKMKILAEDLRREGKNPYLIGIGGSDHIGLWGYIEAFNELVGQGIGKRFTDLVIATGSGGTMSGLAIANYLCGSPVRLTAFTVCDTPEYFYGHLDEMLRSVSLNSEVSARELVRILEAKGLGYARSTDEELGMGLRIAENTGIVLDRVYTLKAIVGMIKELGHREHEVFEQNASILFVHTGGIFGVFDRCVERLLDDSLVTTWPTTSNAR